MSQQDDIARAIEERDAAIRERDALREAQNDAYATEREKAKLWNALVEERDATLRIAKFWMKADEASCERAGAERERAEKAERERDEARVEINTAEQHGWNKAIDAVRGSLVAWPHGGGDIQIMQEVERIAGARAEKAEALLREIEPVIAREVLSQFVVVRERASALLAKIREALPK